MIGLFAGRPMAFSSLYERALDDEDAVVAGSIAVEKIEGPVLLICGTDDQVWPSTRLSEMVIERLEEYDHPFRYEHLRYEGAGHLTIPGFAPDTGSLRRVKLGGGREANELAGADSWRKVLDFWKSTSSSEELTLLKESFGSVCACRGGSRNGSGRVCWIPEAGTQER